MSYNPGGRQGIMSYETPTCVPAEFCNSVAQLGIFVGELHTSIELRAERKAKAKGDSPLRQIIYNVLGRNTAENCLFLGRLSIVGWHSG